MATTNTPNPVTGGAPETDLKAELERLQAENKALKEAATKPTKDFALKIGEKGSVVMTVSGRFPLSPYASDALTVLENGQAIAGFIVANIDKLSHGKPGTVASILAESKAKTLARAKAVLAGK